MPPILCLELQTIQTNRGRALITQQDQQLVILKADTGLSDLLTYCLKQYQRDGVPVRQEFREATQIGIDTRLAKPDDCLFLAGVTDALRASGFTVVALADQPRAELWYLIKTVSLEPDLQTDLLGLLSSMDQAAVKQLTEELSTAAAELASIEQEKRKQLQELARQDQKFQNELLKSLEQED